MVKRAIAGVLIVLGLLGLAGCTHDSDSTVASNNISKDAEQFRILRRIVFVNGITDKYILEIEGFCSVDKSDIGQLAVTCKVATKGKDGATEDLFKKHYLGSADNITWFAEQLDPVNVSTRHYKVIFKPEAIIPDPEIR